MTRPSDLARRRALRPPEARHLDDDHPARQYRLGDQARFTYHREGGGSIVGVITELHQDRVEITRDHGTHVTRHRCPLAVGVLEVPDIVEHPNCDHRPGCSVHAPLRCPPTTLRPGDEVALRTRAGAWGVIVGIRTEVTTDLYESALLERRDSMERPDDVGRWYPVGELTPVTPGHTLDLSRVIAERPGR